MQHDTKHNDDLDYLSELGYAEISVTDTDLADLNRRLKARTGTGSAGLMVTGAITALFLAVTLFFPIINKEVIYPTFADQPAPMESKISVVDSLPEIVLDTVNVTPENFTKPVNPSVDKLFLPQPVTLALANDTLPVINLSSRSVIKEDSSKSKDLKLKFLINSSVTYIHNLKVSDYRNLYYKIRLKDDLTGLPATLAAYETTDGSGTRLKTYAENYLHEDMAKALLRFKKARYQDCINLLYRIATYNENDVNCSFYLGMCFYNQKKYERALFYFNQCLVMANNAFKQEAEYYKASALKEENKTEEATSLFKIIADEGGFYSEKARTKLD